MNKTVQESKQGDMKNTGKMPEPGQRLRLVAMPNDPHPVPVGTEGTVQSVSPAHGSMAAQIMMKWDDGGSLSLIVGIDRWEIID